MSEQYTPNIKNEFERLHKDWDLVRTLEGFKKLTERQQKIIEHSLYLQVRAEWTPDFWSQKAVVSPKTHATLKTEVIPEEGLMHL